MRTGAAVSVVLLSKSRENFLRESNANTNPPANIFAEGWHYVTECYYTSWSFWKFIRYVWTQFIGPNPFLIFFVLLLFALGAKQLFDDRLRADGPAIGG